MAEGAVKWFNESRCFGFNTSKDGAKVFVHYSSIASDCFKSMAEGDSVAFETEDGPKAINVVQS